VSVRIAAGVLMLALIGGGAAYYHRQRQAVPEQVVPEQVVGDNWLDHLHSQNPKVAGEAARQLQALGPQAVPTIRRALQNPSTDLATKKAALKAAGLLGTAASPIVADATAQLADPELTEEAAVALSFMGRAAYGPLRQAASNADAAVRREALRSLGKLHDRAPLSATEVIPLLLRGLTDQDAKVRAVSATYLGIIHADGGSAVPALIETLQDEEAEVRAAAAAALGSFDDYAANALPALRKAAADKDENVAREAGLSIVKLQSSSRK
jgi:HEAT repeat protein